MLHFSPLLVAVGGGAAALVLNRAAPSLGRVGREALIAGTVGAMHLSQKLQELAEEARLGLDDIAAEARARGGQPAPDESGEHTAPPDGGASH
jgi:hypothetical protein